MGFAAFALELYFAAMFGVSGLAKMEQPDRFAATLNRHRILPHWSVHVTSRLIPLAEVVLAIVLVTGLAPTAATVATLVLFAMFGAVETVLVVTKRATECGCYGVAYPQQVDGVSIATSVVLVLLAIVDFWLTTHTAPIPWPWRPIGTILFLAGGMWLGWRILARHSSWQRRGRPGLLAEPPTA